jgi:hypothetical protein
MNATDDKGQIRLVKRYGNRKLYDLLESRYVTLDEIERWVKAGEDVRILDNETGEDLTAVTFAPIIPKEDRGTSDLLRDAFETTKEVTSRGLEATKQIASSAGRAVTSAYHAARKTITQEEAWEETERSVSELTEVARVQHAMILDLIARIERLEAAERPPTKRDPAVLDLVGRLERLEAAAR